MTTGQQSSINKQRRIRDAMTTEQKEDLRKRNLIATRKSREKSKNVNNK